MKNQSSAADLHPITSPGLLAVAVALGTLSLGTASIHAQERATLEEVVVTAQRRDESLQSVPIAVTALSGEEMRIADISDLSGISVRTPGFSMGSFNKGQPQLFIRGIGSNADGAGSDVSVVTFLDEVYIGRAAGQVFDLFDLERVEVLRGPQGTLFGKNAIGGAVNMHTSKPSDTFYGRAEATLGNYDAMVIRGLVSGPLADNVFGKFSANMRQRDGYVESVVTGGEMSNQDNWGVRGALRFTPSDDLELQLIADYSESDEAGNGRVLISPGLLPDIAASAGFRTGSFDKTFADNTGVQKTEIGGLSLRADWQIGNGTLTSISAYRMSEYQMSDDIPAWSLDIVGGPLDADTIVDEESSQFSQEFRFSSSAMDERLQWIAGLYYFTEEVERNEDAQVFVAATAGTNLGFALSFQDNTTDSYSAFLDMTYDLTDALSLTVGGRYTYEEKDIRQVGVAPLVVAHTINESYDVRDNETWDAFTPRVVLNYQFTDSVFAYASYSNGFKSGGYQGTAATAVGAATPFDQEDADAFEIGVKSELLDNRLRLNAAIFTLDYTDLQVLVRKEAFPGDPLGIVVTENAADATSQGLELEFTAVLGGGFEVSGTYAYLDAEYDRYLEPNGINNAGNRLRNAPENAYTLVGSYEHSLGNGGTLNARYEYIYSDERFQDPRNEAAAAIPEYELSNVNLMYVSPAGRYQVSGWVRNLFDEEYLLHNFPLAPFGNPGTIGMPRMVGATVTVNFGS